MNNGTKKILGIVVGVVIVVAAVVVIFFGPDNQIEDTNGPDNFALATITDEDIIACEMSSEGLGKKTGALTATTYHSNKYSGVDMLEAWDYCSAGQTITANHMTVTEGNFCFAVVLNGKIVHKFELNQLTQSYTTEEAGELYLVIAGESANFSFDYSVD